MTQLFGANVWPVDTGTTADHEHEMALLGANHATVARISAVWSALEPSKGTISAAEIAKLDAQVNKAHAEGVMCILTVAASPTWASAGGNWYEVPNIAAYGAICGFLAERYGPTKLCGIEIWNEPNGGSSPLTGYPVSRAKSYTEMTQAAYAKVHPTGVPVLMGAMFYVDTAWLGELYGQGIKGSYDSISIHPYADGLEPGIGNATTTFHTFKGGIEKLKARMVTQGDAATVWITEFGWAYKEAGLTNATRAKYVKEAFQLMRTFSYIAGGTVYEMRDKGDGSEHVGFGMVNSAFVAYESLAAFSEAMLEGGEPPPVEEERFSSGAIGGAPGMGYPGGIYPGGFAIAVAGPIIEPEPGPEPEPPPPTPTPEVIAGAPILAAEVYASLEPIARSDAQGGYPLRALVRAIASMFAQGEEAIRALGDGLDSWERVFDPDRAPLWLLPFVGQAVGVVVDTSRSQAEQVAQIKEEGGWHRGSPAAVVSKVASTLAGAKSIRLVERTTPYSALIVTRPSETPNAVATRNAALSEKPGGMIFTLEQSDLPLVDEGTRTIDASEGNIDTATLAQVT